MRSPDIYPQKILIHYAYFIHVPYAVRSLG